MLGGSYFPLFPANMIFGGKDHVLTWNLNQFDIFILDSRGCISNSKNVCEFGVSYLIQNFGH